MRKSIFTVFLCFIANVAFCQIGNINFKIDTSFFDSQTGNMYTSTSTGASMSYMILPYSYALTVKGMQVETNDEIKSLRSEKLGGTKASIYLKKGVLNTDASKVIVEIYAIEYTESQTIMLTGNYLEKHSELVSNRIEKTARSINQR